MKTTFEVCVGVWVWVGVCGDSGDWVKVGQ